MKKKNLFQLLIVVIGLFSIAINFIMFKDWRGIFYYTILSNIYVICFYAITLILELKGKLKKNNKYYYFKGLMLLAILCTMFIYFIAVSSKNSIYVGHPIECYTVHILIPLLSLLECMIFEDKNVLKYKYVLSWGFTSVLYMLVLITYNNLFNGTFLQGKAYPYDIINFEKIGIIRGTINSLVILMFFMILGVAIVFVDNKMRRRKGE